jgi:hypothetical protein
MIENIKNEYQDVNNKYLIKTKGIEDELSEYRLK